MTGRFVALAAPGLLLAAWSAVAALGYAGLLVLLAGVDLALAARIADLRLRREPSSPVRLYEQGETVLMRSGPALGATIVTVGAAMLYGAELGTGV